MDFLEDDFDIRKIRCGGWSSSKISYKKRGNWTHFYEDKATIPVNRSVQIDYSKKYRPPSRATSEMSPRTTSRVERPASVLPLTSRSSLSMADSPRRVMMNVPPMNITPERYAYSVEFEQTRERQPSRNTSRLSYTARSVAEPVVQIVSDVFVPTTSRIVKKHRGDSLNRFPFRVPPALVREVLSSRERTVDAEETCDESLVLDLRSQRRTG